MPEVFREAVRDEPIQAAGQPSFELTSREPFQVKATIPLEPKVSLGDYRSIRVALEEPSVTAAEIDEVIERRRAAHACWVPVERPVRRGDRVALDIKAVSGEATLLDNQNVEVVADPEGPEPMAGFSERIYGLTSGEQRRFALQQSPREEGQPPVDVEFTVLCHEVKEQQLPELDEAFLSELGEYDTVDALREDIRRELMRRSEAAARERHESAVVDAVVAGAAVEIPPQLVEHQARHLLNQFVANLDRQGIGIQQYLEVVHKDEQQLRDDFLAEGRKSVIRQLVLEAVAEAESLAVPETEVRDYFQVASHNESGPSRAARRAMQNRATREQVEKIILVRRALDRLVAIATGGDDVESLAMSSSAPGASHE